jgi:uncharacterized membrane protein
MAKDVGDLIGTAIGRVARETVQSVAANKKRAGGINLSGGRGLAAGAGLASLAPIAYKGAKNLMGGGSDDSSGGGNPISKAKGKLEGGLKDKVEGNVKDKAKEGVKDALPFGGGNKNDEAGVGKGRRMPIQQSMDIGAPLKTVYNEWTQFEEWPQFMHRVESLSQEDDCTVKVKAKIWGKSKEFTATIVDQVPDQMIKWEVTEGITHTGIVTFSELAPNLTHVEVNMDVQPGSLLEKAARGMRHIKRAVRADLHRFKAHVMMNQEEQGAWRGTIEDGEKKRASSKAVNTSSSSRSQGSSSSRSQGSSRSASSRSRGSSKPKSSSSRSASGGSSKPKSSSSRSASGGSSKSKSSSARSSGSSSKPKSSSSRSSGGSNGSSASSRSRASGSSSRSKSSSNGRSTTAKSSRSSSSNGRKKAGAKA